MMGLLPTGLSLAGAKSQVGGGRECSPKHLRTSIGTPAERADLSIGCVMAPDLELGRPSVDNFAMPLCLQGLRVTATR